MGSYYWSQDERRSTKNYELWTLLQKADGQIVLMMRMPTKEESFRKHRTRQKIKSAMERVEIGDLWAVFTLFC